MKKILLVLVGGTICTAFNEDGNLSIDKNSGLWLTENFLNSDSPFKDEVQFTLTENLGILSENMTVDKWNVIIDTYYEYIKKDSFDGVIFAHGTDTLAFTASLFSMLLAGAKIPHFFVSANAPLSLKRSNGNDNFKAAVECICKGISPNVYVTYKNISDKKTYLHLASRIEQCKNYSEDFFSDCAVELENVSDLKALPKCQGENILSDKKLKNCVLKINPYVGIDYKAFDYSGFKAVLHGTYHSGTAWVDGVKTVLDNCNCDVYLAPSKLIKGTYETVHTIGDYSVNGNKVNFICGMTEETLYSKLLIAYSLFEDEKERSDFIKNERNYEYRAPFI